MLTVSMRTTATRRTAFIVTVLVAVIAVAVPVITRDETLVTRSDCLSMHLGVRVGEDIQRHDTGAQVLFVGDLQQLRVQSEEGLQDSRAEPEAAAREVREEVREGVRAAVRRGRDRGCAEGRHGGGRRVGFRGRVGGGVLGGGVRGGGGGEEQGLQQQCEVCRTDDRDDRDFPFLVLCGD